jgi:hypothetical protein
MPPILRLLSEPAAVLEERLHGRERFVGGPTKQFLVRFRKIRHELSLRGKGLGNVKEQQPGAYKEEGRRAMK